MLQLCRTVRFCLNAHDGQPAASRHNGFSAWPAMRGLGHYYELHVACLGEADPLTGYFINITHIDEAVRTHALPRFETFVREGQTGSAAPMGELMRRLFAALDAPLKQTVDSLRLDLTPFYSLQIRRNAMGHAILRQQFEFAAAHRLHVPSFSDEENRRIFGKCNNPSGHGHNYRIEVAVEAPIDAAGRLPLIEQIDEVVDKVVMERLDHKHLNGEDVPEFAKLNPSVENIAKVIYEMLAGPVKKLSLELAEISVWETSRTVCTYRG